jgi:hypothetical protein
MNDLSQDYFDCPHCGVKSVIYKNEAQIPEYEIVTIEAVPITFEWMHHIVKCTRKGCEKLVYLKVREQFHRPGTIWQELTGEGRIVEIQYPTNNSQLPDYIPEKIRRYYKEAMDAFTFGLLSSASIMCRKVIYEICDKQNSVGDDYKEKIKNLGFDKRITDPLLNIKNIGDDTVHANGWDKNTIEKALNALAIIIDMIYTQENRIKEFSTHYSQVNQQREEKQ